MTQFFLSAFALTALALLFVLLPLLRRHITAPASSGNQANLVLFRQQLKELDEDRASGVLEQQQYEAARRDLERVLVSYVQNTTQIPAKSGRWVAPILALLIPVLAIGVYLKVGNYQALEHQVAAASKAADIPDTATMQVLVERLAEKMQTRPDDLQGWLMLGRSALVLGQGQRAVAAYTQASRLAPKDPEIMLAYADALAQVAQSFAGKPLALIEAALKLDPLNLQGLWLMGLAAFQQGDHAKAVGYWATLEAKLSPDSKEAQTLRRLIVQARQSAPKVAVPP